MLFPGKSFSVAWLWIHWSHVLLSPPLDDATFLEHTPPSSSGGEGEGGVGEVTLLSSTPSAPVSALAPSLTPASQPTISLLTDNSADALSVESLTLLPPADSPHLHPCTSHISATLSLQRPDASIPEEEDDDGREGEKEEQPGEEDEELQEEEGSLMEETETDATVKEETTTSELITPTEEAPEEPEGGEEPGEEDTPVQEKRDTELQERGDAECAEKTEEVVIHSETPDSPELD